MFAVLKMCLRGYPSSLKKLENVLIPMVHDGFNTNSLTSKASKESDSILIVLWCYTFNNIKKIITNDDRYGDDVYQVRDMAACYHVCERRRNIDYSILTWGQLGQSQQLAKDTGFVSLCLQISVLLENVWSLFDETWNMKLIIIFYFWNEKMVLLFVEHIATD